jgi:hypothetical protein
MTQIPSAAKKVPSRWQFLWCPMLLIALGFHGFLLFFPWQAQSSKQATKEDGKSVKLSRLTTLKPGQAETEQPAIAEALRNANQSDIVVKASPSPSPSPVPKAVPPSPVAIARQTAPTKAKVPVAKKANEVTAVLTQQEQGFVGRLQKLEGREVSEPVSSTLFPNPEDFYQDLAKELGKPGIVGIEYVSFQRPEAVYQQLARLYPDYAIAPKANYGDGLVYEFRQGNFVRYLNLVRAKLGAGTLVILWSRQPG